MQTQLLQELLQLEGIGLQDLQTLAHLRRECLRLSETLINGRAWHCVLSGLIRMAGLCADASVFVAGSVPI